MKGSWFRRAFLGGTLGVAMLLSSAVLAQAQTCTTRYNPLLQQYETQCTNDLASLYGMLGDTQIKPWSESMESVNRAELGRLQNEILRLRLQELQRQQALRQQNGQR
jgi:hypothetical protein